MPENKNYRDEVQDKRRPKTCINIHCNCNHEKQNAQRQPVFDQDIQKLHNLKIREAKIGQ